MSRPLHDVDFTVATTARSRARFHYYATPQQLLPLLEEKAQWMKHAALVFGREDSGLTNDELALADVLTGVPMVADYPSLESWAGGDGVLLSASSLQLANCGPRQTEADENQLHGASSAGAFTALLARLDVDDDHKTGRLAATANWLAYSSATPPCCIVCCMILKKVMPGIKYRNNVFSYGFVYCILQ